MDKTKAYAKLLRIPGLAGLATPAIIGGITAGAKDPFSLILLFIIGSLAAIYGFILNDFADVEIDKLIKELHGRPLVSGDISRENAVMICVLCVMFSFFFMMILWNGQTLDNYKFMAVISVLIAGVLGSFYNMYGKKIAGSDFFVAISMGFIVLMGALAVGIPTIFTWIVFLLTFNNVLHMNAVEGGIKDADHDYIMGVKNIALASGVKVENNKITIPTKFKAFSLGIRIFSAILLFAPFFIFGYEYYTWQIAILTLGVIGVLYFSFKLLNIKTFDRNQIRKYISTQSFLRYSLVPIMLIQFMGIIPAILLAIFPIVWYIIFAPLIGEKLLRPRM